MVCANQLAADTADCEYSLTRIYCTCKCPTGLFFVNTFANADHTVWVIEWNLQHTSWLSASSAEKMYAGTSTPQTEGYKISEALSSLPNEVCHTSLRNMLQLEVIDGYLQKHQLIRNSLLDHKQGKIRLLPFAPMVCFNWWLYTCFMADNLFLCFSNIFAILHDSCEYLATKLLVLGWKRRGL